MNEYKSVTKFLSKNEEQKTFKSFIKNLFSKIFICLIILLVCLIVVKYDKNNKNLINSFLLKNDLSFAKLNNLYEKYIGNILPFETKKNNNITSVFNEKFVYKDISIYKNGYKLEVDNDYYIPLIESGVVVFVGENEDYGKTVIVEQVDGVCVTYGNKNANEIAMFTKDSTDLVKTSGDSNYEYLTLKEKVFEKDGEYLKYNDFI